MTEIVTGEGWEMRLGKWQDSPPEIVDHVICDPPYDDATHSGGRRAVTGRTTNTGIVACLEIPFDPLTVEDIAEVASLTAIAERWILAFCSAEQLGTYRELADDEWIRAGAFVKTNPTPQFSGDRPATWGDGIAIMHRAGRKRWNGGGDPAVWFAARGYQKRADKHHPTEKPLALMAQLVRDFTDPGDLIWDPYAGSATTGVAALRLGRRFLGHEVEPEYFETACERLREAESADALLDRMTGKQSNLF